MKLEPCPAHPMRYGGGLFLCCVGAEIAAGAALGGNAMGPLLGIGFLLGTLAIFAVRSRVAKRFGRPTRSQVLLMCSAIALEVGAFALLSWCVSTGAFSNNERLIWSIVLAIVAAHFLLMAWSFGPWIFHLGVAIMLWLLFVWLQHLELGAMLFGDGLLKLGFGMVMAAPLAKRGSGNA